jgi:hypothetical protein
MKEAATGGRSNGYLRSLFVNVSTTDTGNENLLRPCADKTYWLKPEEIVQITAPLLLHPAANWNEVDIYKKSPWFRPEIYDPSAVLERWMKQMGTDDAK